MIVVPCPPAAGWWGVAFRPMAELTAVHIPPGPQGLGALLPPLRAALAGTGPAIAPLPAVGSVPPAYLDNLIAAVALDKQVADDVAVVVATSGSTGNPAGVALSRSNVAAAAGALGRWRASQPGTARPLRWLASLPLHSIGGLMAVIRSLCAGEEPVAAPWLAGAAAFRATDLLAAGRALHAATPPEVGLAVSLVPTMAERLLAADIAVAAGEVFDLLLVGGAAARPGSLRQLRAAGCVAVDSYGMTETAGGVVFDSMPAPGVGVHVQSDGRLVIAGPMVAQGYRDGREPQDWSTHAGLPAFRTRDRGEVTADGRIRILGRSDDVVAVGGVNVDTAAVARLLAAQPGIAEAVVVAVPDKHWGARLAAFAIPSSVAACPAPGELAAVVNRELGRAAVPRDLVLRPTLPRLPGGKPDRLALARTAVDPDADRPTGPDPSGTMSP